MAAEGHPQFQILHEIHLKSVVDRAEHLRHHGIDLLADHQVSTLQGALHIGLSAEVNGNISHLALRKINVERLLQFPHDLFCHQPGLIIETLILFVILRIHRHVHVMPLPDPLQSNADVHDQAVQHNAVDLKIIFPKRPLNTGGHRLQLLPVILHNDAAAPGHQLCDAEPFVKLISLHPDSVPRFPLNGEMMPGKNLLHLFQIIGKHPFRHEHQLAEGVHFNIIVCIKQILGQITDPLFRRLRTIGSRLFRKQFPPQLLQIPAVITFQSIAGAVFDTHSSSFALQFFFQFFYGIPYGLIAHAQLFRQFIRRRISAFGKNLKQLFRSPAFHSFSPFRFLLFIL